MLGETDADSDAACLAGRSQVLAVKDCVCAIWSAQLFLTSLHPCPSRASILNQKATFAVQMPAMA